MTKIFPLVFAAFLISASNVSASEPEILTKADLAQLFPGNFQAVVSGSITLNISAQKNGTIMGQMQGHKDRGKWSLKSNQLCIEWANWMDGKASCSHVKESDGWYHGNGVKFRKL